jgi:hypothetical protein
VTWPHGDPDAVVRHVLAQPAYRLTTQSTNVAPQPSLLEIAWNWLVQHVLNPLFGPIARALGAAHNAGTAAGVLLVIVALLALAFVVVRLALAFGRRGGRASESAVSPLGELAFGATDWRLVAREAAARGEYGRAIAALWAAALVVLDERALVSLDPARTPGEYRRLVRRLRAPAAAPFDTLGERFVYATFAAGEASARDFEVAERALRAFEPAVSGMSVA